MRRLYRSVLVFILGFSLLHSSFAHAEELKETLSQEEQVALQKDLEEMQEGLTDIEGGLTQFAWGVWETTVGAFWFVWVRKPNPWELGYDAFLTPALDVGAQSKGVSFGDSSEAKSFLRDTSKLFTGGLKYLQGVEIGGTGLMFDEANLSSQFVKVATKYGLIFLLKTQLGLSKETASKFSNYLGDPIPRSMIVAGKERQKVASDGSYENLGWVDWAYLKAVAPVDFLAYYVLNFKQQWLVDALQEVVPKLLIVTAVDEVFVRKFKDWAAEKMFFYVSNTIIGVSLSHKNDVRSNIQALSSKYSRLLAWTYFIPLVYTTETINQVVSTYLLATPARVIMDGVKVFKVWYYSPETGELKELSPTKSKSEL